MARRRAKSKQQQRVKETVIDDLPDDKEVIDNQSNNQINDSGEYYIAVEGTERRTS